MLSRAAKVLLREAVGEGPEGMEMVADTFFNRGLTRKLSLDDVATQSGLNKRGVRVYQYTGAGDQNLDAFVARQPIMFQNLAERMIEERLQKDYQPKYPGVEHFVTRELYDRRHDPDVSQWVRDYVKVGQVGRHVLLMPPPKPKR